MTRFEQDSRTLGALIDDHDRALGNGIDQDGKTAGYNHVALLGAAGVRAKQLLEGHGILRQTLSPQQTDELLEFLVVMWRDGFAIGVRSQQAAD